MIRSFLIGIGAVGRKTGKVLAWHPLIILIMMGCIPVFILIGIFDGLHQYSNIYRETKWVFKPNQLNQPNKPRY